MLIVTKTINFPRDYRSSVSLCTELNMSQKTSQLLIISVNDSACFWSIVLLPVGGNVAMLTDRLLLTVSSLFTFISALHSWLVSICLLLNSTKSLIVFTNLAAFLVLDRMTPQTFYHALLTVNYYILYLKWRDIFIIVRHNGISLIKPWEQERDQPFISFLFFYILSWHSWNQNPELIVDSINSIMKI